MKEKRTIPELRFPGFEGNWEEKRIGNVCKINPKSDVIPEKFIYIDLECVDSGRLLFQKNISKEKAPSRAQRLLISGDILFQMVRPYQKNNYYFQNKTENKYVASTGYAQLRTKNSSDFLYQLLHLDSFIENVLSHCTGTSYPSINSNDLSKIKISLPSLPEQKKIAAFLSDIDRKIELISRKKELMEQYKKGMMQKLFSRELRFKDDDGGEFPDWEEKRLGEVVFDLRGGASLTPGDFVQTAGKEVIPKKAIGPGGILNLDSKAPTLCSKDFFDNNKSNTASKIHLITTLRDLVPSGPNIGYIVQFNFNKEFVLAQGVYGFQIKNNEINRNFLIHFSNSSFYRRYMNKVMVGSTQVHIRNSDFLNLLILLPVLSEQKKIENFLSNLDEKIESLTHQKDQLETFKKGLLQKMFI